MRYPPLGYETGDVETVVVDDDDRDAIEVVFLGP
jgi:hypothetical protein